MKKTITILFVFLVVCLSSIVFASIDKQKELKYTPGKETKVTIDNKYIGGGYFLFYVPEDYTNQQILPVIFFYHGAGCKPSTELLQTATNGKGFIIVAMEYVPREKEKMTQGQYLNYLKCELKSMREVKNFLSDYFEIDKRKMFISGISQGGWLSSALLEYKTSTWAGAVILCAGRQNGIVPSMDNNLIKDKPIYIAAGENDMNLQPANHAAAYYERIGAKVTFEEYKGLGHAADPNSVKLHDWLTDAVK